MSKPLNSLIGMAIDDFHTLIQEKEIISVRRARLIPVYKAGEEMALTSIFLSAIRLVDEFKKDILSAIGMLRSGSLYVFTEITFLDYDNHRPDGLILIVRGGKIKDAALLELKNKNANLDEQQIVDYIAVAKRYKIPNLITISNQFVSTPTQSPVDVKVPKSVKLYHLSWTYILTMAHILLFDNDKNIKDADQKEILREIVDYIEHDISGVSGFNQMLPGWKETVAHLIAGVRINKTDQDAKDAVIGWLQEERDMALLLSRKLGSLVKSGIPKYKDDLNGRINSELRNLIQTNKLQSTLQVHGAVSSIAISAYFERRTVNLSVSVDPPLDKTVRGQIGWLKRQLASCEQKNPELFQKIADEIAIDIEVKYSSAPVQYTLSTLDKAPDDLRYKAIKKFKILHFRDLKGQFGNRKGIVTNMESMLLDFYQGIIQHLKNWEKPAPKIQDGADKAATLEAIE